MIGGRARSVEKKDSLLAVLKHVGKVCSEADVWAATPVPAGGLSLRILSRHCN